MMAENVAKDTLSGLDTGGWRLIEWRYNKGEREKGNPNGHRNRLLRRARRLLHRGPGRRPGRLRRLTRRPPLRRGPSPARRRAWNGSVAPSGAGWGHPTGEGARGPLRAVCGLRRAPPKAGAGRLGCAPPKAAPSNYATSVLRKSRNSKCELGLTFAKSGLRSQLEQPCEQSHTRRGSRATM